MTIVNPIDYPLHLVEDTAEVKISSITALAELRDAAINLLGSSQSEQVFGITAHHQKTYGLIVVDEKAVRRLRLAVKETFVDLDI